MRRLVSSLVAALPLAACHPIESVGSDDPADASGEYALTITNGKNGCKWDPWTEGGVTTSVPLTVTQTGTSVRARVGGAAAIVVALAFGTTEYTGEVSGRTLALTLYGTTTPKQHGNCVYTPRSTARATLSGDFLSGTVEHGPRGNGNPDCAAIDCVSVQAFNATRPPRP